MLASAGLLHSLSAAESACYIARHVEARKRDYSETLFLPQTDFPMRAGLPQKEPEILARWEKAGLYRPVARGRQGPREIHPA